MTYFFSGVIAPLGEQTVQHDLVERFGGVGRVLERPFPGWAVAFAADYDDVNDCLHQATTSDLVPWSRAYPDQAFVYICVECWGGDCDQEGFAFKNGSVLQAIPLEEDRRMEPDPLSRLLGAIGIAFPAGTPFEPFSRNWIPPRNTRSD